MDGGRARRIHGHRGRWFAVKCLVRCHVDGGVEGGVIPPLSPAKKRSPRIRLVCDETPEIVFEAAFNDLSLTI
ncbi:hypothetical protein RchiOBHm_Chr6g0309681 [Rosa chinensis]|uniref:Uncharacterized protein n=2 Tax=Rosa chinensis TaxID=74649 RepID=A0A2P6Q138_ROSCH|nr:hypothetical protein RchiOBHm_Chr6g0309681 [Rosa chinensis]